MSVKLGTVKGTLSLASATTALIVGGRGSGPVHEIVNIKSKFHPRLRFASGAGS